MSAGGLDVRRAADRFRTLLPGVTTLHCFSSGAHYDPDNTHFGPLVTCDEHRLEPGAGFAAHRHSGVVIVSRPITGALRHEHEHERGLIDIQDVVPASAVIGPGEVQILETSTGVQHAETAAGTEPARFVQMVLLAAGSPVRYRRITLGVGDLEHALSCVTPSGDAHLLVVRPNRAAVQLPPHRRRFAFVVAGAVRIARVGDGGALLASGDSVRILDEGAISLASADEAEILVWNLP